MLIISSFRSRLIVTTQLEEYAKVFISLINNLKLLLQISCCSEGITKNGNRNLPSRIDTLSEHLHSLPHIICTPPANLFAHCSQPRQTAHPFRVLFRSTVRIHSSFCTSIKNRAEKRSELRFCDVDLSH